MRSLKINNCSIFVDNPKSWFLKYAKSLVKNIVNILPKYINKETDPSENILDKSIITQKKNWNKRIKKKLYVILKRYLEKN